MKFDVVIFNHSSYFLSLQFERKNKVVKMQNNHFNPISVEQAPKSWSKYTTKDLVKKSFFQKIFLFCWNVSVKNIAPFLYLHFVYQIFKDFSGLVTKIKMKLIFDYCMFILIVVRQVYNETNIQIAATKSSVWIRELDFFKLKI